MRLRMEHAAIAGRKYQGYLKEAKDIGGERECRCRLRSCLDKTAYNMPVDFAGPELCVSATFLPLSCLPVLW